MITLNVKNASKRITLITPVILILVEEIWLGTGINILINSLLWCADENDWLFLLKAESVVITTKKCNSNQYYLLTSTEEALECGFLIFGVYAYGKCSCVRCVRVTLMTIHEVHMPKCMCMLYQCQDLVHSVCLLCVHVKTMCTYMASKNLPHSPMI